MLNYFHIFFFTFASLFSITNPIGISSVFLAMTGHHPLDKQHQIARRVAIYSFILLMVTFFAGTYVLDFFGISLSSVQIAGGILVFFTAWGMLNTQPKLSSEEKKEAFDKDVDYAFFPLTMPLTAGAGAMAVTIALASHLKDNNNFTLLGVFTVLAAIAVVCITVWICYRFARNLFQFLGHTGSNVITRLTAFILLAIAVTMIGEGLTGFIQPLLQQTPTHPL